MATFIKQKELEVALISSAVVRELQADSVVSVPAMLMALADVESSYQLDAKGDGGASFGLWQINSKVWTFDAERLTDVGYQIEAVRPVFEQANAAVQKALGIIHARCGTLDPSKTGADRCSNEKIKRGEPEKEMPLWYSIIWQYGAGSLTATPRPYGFLNWIAETFDTTTEGFAAYRKQHGRNLEGTYFKRQKTVQATYSYYLDPQYVAGSGNILGDHADEAGRADFYEDVVKKTGSDLANLPRKALPWVPVALVLLGLGVAAWSTARRQVTG